MRLEGLLDSGSSLRLERSFLESEAVNEAHLGANINSVEELRWVSRLWGRGGRERCQ